VSICAACSQENPDVARFCLRCGAPLATEAHREERRLVSVLFVDIVGFTSRSEKLDPEDVRSFLTPYYEQVRGEIERHGGRIE
jgi:class 3 adenylate cyclase